MNKLIISTLIISSTVNILVALDEMPNNAQSGQCFTKAFFPAVLTKTTRTTSIKKIKLRKSELKYKVIPAKYEWYEERIKVSDGLEKIITSPAVYKTISERILVKGSQKSWNRNGKKAFNSCVLAAKGAGMNVDTAAEGTCYYEHFQAAKYTNVAEKILATEASQRIVAIPARYKTTNKRIITQDKATKLIPQEIKYKKVKEKVITAPARSEWRKTTCQDRGCNQSQVVCLVEVPQQYKIITKKVVLQPSAIKKTTTSPVYTDVAVRELVTPATTKIVAIPATYKTISKRQKIENSKYFWSNSSSQNALTRLRSQCDKICLTQTPPQYKTVTKQVLVTAASSKKVKTPAQYKTIKIRRVIREESFKTITIPAEYKEVRIERERSKGFAKWMPIVCESNMTPNFIKKVQQALKYQGFYHGEVDGIWGQEEKSAVRAYQKANKLTVTKLSIETMKSLGIQ